MKIKHLFIFFLLLIQSNSYAIGDEDDIELECNIDSIDTLLYKNEIEKILSISNDIEPLPTLIITKKEYDELLRKTFNKVRTKTEFIHYPPRDLIRLIKKQSYKTQIKTGRLKIVG